jgi:hypothetical protein
MTRIGITGHQRLAEEGEWRWVTAEMGRALARIPPPLLGISSLAVGADQLFAEMILGLGGKISAVIPFDSYAEKFEGNDRLNYCRLRDLSSGIETLPRIGSDEECYMAAGKRVVDLSTSIIAVWNGKQAAGLGGTADVVEYAISKGKRVVHINPVDKSVAEK